MLIDFLSILTNLIGEYNVMKKFEILNAIYANCSLSSKEILVVQYFVYKSNQKGICYPSVNTIAKECGVSERTVQRATKKLQEKGYIIIEKRTANGKQTSNEYSLAIEDIEGKLHTQHMQQTLKDKVTENVNNEIVCIFLEDMLLMNDPLRQEYQDEYEIKHRTVELASICFGADIEDKSSTDPVELSITINEDNGEKFIIIDKIERKEDGKKLMVQKVDLLYMWEVYKLLIVFYKDMVSGMCKSNGRFVFYYISRDIEYETVGRFVISNNNMMDHYGAGSSTRFYGVPP